MVAYAPLQNYSGGEGEATQFRQVRPLPQGSCVHYSLPLIHTALVQQSLHATLVSFNAEHDRTSIRNVELLEGSIEHMLSRYKVSPLPLLWCFNREHKKRSCYYITLASMLAGLCESTSSSNVCNLILNGRSHEVTGLQHQIFIECTYSSLLLDHGKRYVYCTYISHRPWFGRFKLFLRF